MHLHRLVLGAALVLARVAAAQPVGAPGYTVTTIPTPGVVQGGVAQAGPAVFVGQGSFGAGTQSVVRLVDGTATTIATGFNSLGGFDWDPLTDVLWVVDNGGDLPGAATGDTVFAIPAASTRTTAIAATAATAAPAGSVPFAQDVTVVDGTVLVSDGAGPGAGRVVTVAGGVVTPLITGLAYTAGLAAAGGALYVGDVDVTFTGAVKKYAVAGGASQGTLRGGLSGVYGVAVDGSDVLATGGFADDFSSATLVAIAPDGTVTERASGFGFSSDLDVDPVRGEALVLDFGVSEIAVVCPDADADDACDACTGGATLAKPQIVAAKLGGLPGTQKLVLKGEMTLPVGVAAALDPQHDGARLQLRDGAGDPAFDVTVAGGVYDTATRQGWRRNAAGTTFTWKSHAGVGGLTKLVVKRNAVTGVVRIVAAAVKATLDLSDADLPLTLTATLRQAGGCGSAAPTCTANAAGTTIKCR